MTQLVGAILITLLLSSCNFGTSKGSDGQSSAKPGSLVVLGIDQYQCGSSLSGVKAAAASFDSGMSGLGWNIALTATDSSVNASDFYNYENSVDAIYYGGHGDNGLFAFSDYCAGGSQIWGVGNDNGDPNNMTGIPEPAGARLKWIFAVSSDTVAGPIALAPSTGYPEDYAEWEAMFVAGGGIHGIYGFWQGAPDVTGGVTCFTQDDPQGLCDITDGADGPVVKSLLNNLYSASHTPMSVHTSWVQAANDAGYSQGWSIMEDQNSLGDTFTGPNGVQNQVPSGNGLFYWGGPSGSITVNPVTVQSTTFTLSPLVITPAAINDQTIISEGQPYVSSIAETNDGQTINLTTPSGDTVLHEYAVSGAISFYGGAHYNTPAFSQATALAAAEAFLQSSLGLPSDAVLVGEDENYIYNKATNSRSITGYTFDWGHSSPAIGDQIVVLVDDDAVSTSTCTGGTKVLNNPPAKPVVICLGYTTTTTHTPNVSYAKMQWHAPSSTRRSIESAGRSTGGPSIDAYTASLSLPTGSVVTAYTSGYWYGNTTMATTTAEPAWLFTIGGTTVIAVDAFSGVVLGAQAL